MIYFPFTLNPKVSNFDPKVDQCVAASFYLDVNCFFPLQRFDSLLDQNLIPWDLMCSCKCYLMKVWAIFCHFSIRKGCLE